MESDAVAAAQGMRDLIWQHRSETEAERRLAPAIVERLVATRLCRMALDRELGGLATPGVDALEAYEALASAEASVPWIAWNNALVCFFARYLSEPARKEVFADPTCLFAQSTRPTGAARIDGSAWVVRGRWSLVSGVELSQQILLHCAIEEPDGTPRRGDGGAPETRFLFVPTSACDVLDTWHVGGLRGTGSHDVAVDEVRVPREHALDPFRPAPPTTSALGRVPISPNIGAGLAAQTLGLARAALDAIDAQARAAVTPGPMPDLRDRPDAQASVVVHAAAVDAARGHLHRTVGALWRRAEAGDDAREEERSAVYGAARHAMEVSAAAVDAMSALGGTRALYVDSPLERIHRDLHAMLRHVVASPAFVEDAGRARFGLDTQVPWYPI